MEDRKINILQERDYYGNTKNNCLIFNSLKKKPKALNKVYDKIKGE